MGRYCRPRRLRDKENRVQDLLDLIEKRFGERLEAPNDFARGVETIRGLLDHRVIRRFSDKPIDMAMLRLLCAAALSSPTKSDLQQGDILIVADAEKRAKIASLLPDQPWMAKAPAMLLFLGNNRRQRQIAEWRAKPWPNDHLDSFFNAAVDGAIVMTTFVVAAEAAGLGCCPISTIRNHARTVSDLCGLPAYVFPVAGLGIGWPADPGFMSARLPMAARVHVDRFDETAIRDKVDAYDRRRDGIFPYRQQRDEARFGRAEFYGWSEDKARQYATPDRADFGAYVRGQGFRLD
jgi:nitroreductase